MGCCIWTTGSNNLINMQEIQLSNANTRVNPGQQSFLLKLVKEECLECRNINKEEIFLITTVHLKTSKHISKNEYPKHQSEDTPTKKKVQEIILRW